MEQEKQLQAVVSYGLAVLVTVAGMLVLRKAIQG